MIYVDDLTERHNFIDPATGVEDPDAYFVIRKEMPYEGYLDYLDAAVSYEMVLPGEDEGDGSDPMKGTANKMTVRKIQDLLMENGLVEIVGVIDRKTQKLLTREDWKKLPTPLLKQILQSIQATAVTSVPN